MCTHTMCFVPKVKNAARKTRNTEKTFFKDLKTLFHLALITEMVLTNDRFTARQMNREIHFTQREGQSHTHTPLRP